MFKIALSFIAVALCFSSFSLAQECADFSGAYKAAEEPKVPLITMSQHGCSTLNFIFEDKDLVLHLDGKTRTLRNEFILKVIQTGKINKRYMMIFLTVEYMDLQRTHHKESTLLFEKVKDGNVFVTFKGDVPDQVIPEKRYQLVKQ